MSEENKKGCGKGTCGSSTCGLKEEFECNPECCSTECVDYINGLKDKVTKYEEEISKYKDICLKLEEDKNKILTLASDLSNQNNMLKMQIVSVRDDSIKKFASEVLKCFDLIGYAKKQINDQNVLDGLNMIEKDLLNIFNKFGVEEVQTSTFDANLHEVISVLDGDDKIEIIEKGYILNNKILLKPAKLVIYKPQDIK
jgi:molecular chaperone GrpE (heat shock protein)